MRSNQIVKLDVNSSSLLKGLDYALLSWTSTFNRMGKPNPYTRMEKIMIGVTAEIEFQNYLKSKGIRFDLKGQTKWYQVDRYDISINDYPIDVKANLLDLRSQYIINRLSGTTLEEWLLKCQALVPMDQFNCKSARKINKCYVFPFICGYFEPGKSAEPFIHAFWDYRWLKKGDYKTDSTDSFLRVSYSNPSSNASIRVFGARRGNVACIEDINLTSSTVTSTNKFFKVFSILWTGKGKPNGDLTVKWMQNNLKERITSECSFELEKTDSGYEPTANNWQSVHFYDYSIYLAGWCHDEDMRVIGKEYKRFSKDIEQYPEIKVDNWGCDILELNPIASINSLK